MRQFFDLLDDLFHSNFDQIVVYGQLIREKSCFCPFKAERNGFSPLKG